MAASNAVWGIDIGQCAIKALRCSKASDGETLIADAFDYIEYPKILNQPEADPEKLVQAALAKFLSRNTLRGDKVAISVPGQSGLSRFIKLPPIEAKKIPDIVKYEAKQQIPFELDDVIWDYQPLIGANEEEGFALETEVGLFAMKRDQVFSAISPLVDAGIELDVVQLMPLCIYNFATFELLDNLREMDSFDPEDPPESIVLLSLGTETTDLVVTNGFRVWQRSVPMGGNQFTKQLTKEMKLTFSKAEKTKRNVRKEKDPKAIFQAMRPVYNDLVTEVQRSIGYFQSIDRQAKIGRIVALGNAVKLPGLHAYLSKNLNYDVVDFKSYKQLTGAEVTGNPKFRSNALSFAGAYGLCVQGLNEAKLSTNLLPREILTERLIRSKKPWAVAAASLLLLGCCLNFFFHSNAWKSVHQDVYSTAINASKSASSTESRFQGDDANQVTEAELWKEFGEEVVGNADGRLLWPELIAAINAALEVEGAGDPEEFVSFKEKPLEERPEIHVVAIEPEYLADLSQWYNSEVEKTYLDSIREIETSQPPVEQPADAEQDTSETDAEEEKIEGPSGPGYVIEITGYHYFNRVRETEGRFHIRNTLIEKLTNGEIELPGGPGKPPVKVTMKELGISHPVIHPHWGGITIEQIPNPDYVPPENTGRSMQPRPGNRPPAGPVEKPTISVRVYRFKVQLCWREKPASLRELERLEEQKRLQDQAKLEVAQGG